MEAKVRLFVRWLIACLVCAGVLAVVWLAGEWWLNWDRATAAAAGIGVAAVVLAPMAWWAPRELTASESPVVGPRVHVGAGGGVRGSVIVGDHNTVSTTTAVAPPAARIGVGEGGGSRRPELIHFFGPWKTRAEAETAIYAWISWYNNERLHSALDDVPPAEYEAAYHATVAAADGAR
jgi:hypothetical protein